MDVVNEGTITVSGNTVIDALYLVVYMIKNNIKLTDELQEQLKTAGYDTARLSKNKKLVLITSHHRDTLMTSLLICATPSKRLQRNILKSILSILCTSISMYANPFWKSLG